jgi:hypothetical protein
MTQMLVSGHEPVMHEQPTPEAKSMRVVAPPFRSRPDVRNNERRLDQTRDVAQV